MDPRPLDQFLAAAVQIVHQAGEILMARLGQVAVEEKAPRDLVTAADRESQGLIEASLAAQFPDHGILGEEHAPGRDWTRGTCWVIDPLDGTTNYVHGLPGFSVSVALCHRAHPLLGVVHDPWLRETYTCSLDQAAALNGQPIQPSRCEDLDRSLLVSSFPSTVTPASPELIRFNRVVQRATTRRLGSAALNLCYVAGGRLDGYWASTLRIWDVAAGALIAQRAGACCRHLSGAALDWSDPQLLVAATQPLSDSLIPLLQIGDD